MISLLSLGIENYRSIYSRQDLVLPDISDSRVTAIFGPNAGGKSNVTSSLNPIVACIFRSADANFMLPYDPFLLKHNSEFDATSFEVTFSYQNKVYVYGFSYNHEQIISEELLEKPSRKGKAKTIFRRDRDGSLNPAAASNGFGKKIISATRKDTLLITKARESNNFYSNIVFEFAGSLLVRHGAITGLDPQFYDLLRGDENLRSRAVELLRQCDFSIRDLFIEDYAVPEELLARIPDFEDDRVQANNKISLIATAHAIRDVDESIVGRQQFNLVTQESAGTNEFIGIIVPLLYALDNGKTIVLDDFGAFMHPNLTDAILDLFDSEENTSGARLILNTHNTFIMERRKTKREDIVLVEKNLAEETKIFPLVSKSVRSNEAFEKRYRAGLYGAIPILSHDEA